MKKNLLFVFALFALAAQAQNTDTIVRSKSVDPSCVTIVFENTSTLHYVDPKDALPNPEDIIRDSNGQDSGESYYFYLGRIGDSTVTDVADTSVITTTVPFLRILPDCGRYGRDFQTENADKLEYKGTEAAIIHAVEGTEKENTVIPGTPVESKVDNAPNGKGYPQTSVTPKVKKGRFRTGPGKMMEKQSIIRH